MLARNRCDRVPVTLNPDLSVTGMGFHFTMRVCGAFGGEFLCPGTETNRRTRHREREHDFDYDNDYEYECECECDEIRPCDWEEQHHTMKGEKP